MTLRRIEGEIEVSAIGRETARILYEAVKPEIQDSPSERSSMSIHLYEDRVTIKIQALDSASFRASLNSSIRWTRLALDIIETIKSTG